MVKREKTYKGYIASFSADDDGLWQWQLVNARHTGNPLDIHDVADLLNPDGSRKELVKDRLASGRWHKSAQDAVAAFMAYVDELTLFDAPQGLVAPHTGELLIRIDPHEHLEFAIRAYNYGVTAEELAAALLRRHIEHRDGFDDDVASAEIQEMRDLRDQAIGRGEAEPDVYSDHILDAIDLPDVPGGLVEPDDPLTAQERVRLLMREGDVEGALRVFRKLRNASWSNLQKASRALLNEDHDPFSTANVEASSKSHIRTLHKWTGLSIAELSKHIDDITEEISS